MKIKEISKVRKYKCGYEVRHVVIDGEEFGGEDVVLRLAYTPDNHYIGAPKLAYQLCKKRGIKPEPIKPDDDICSIGFCEKKQKWYGWSHRAICGFGIGSTCKKGDCHYMPSTPQELFDHITSIDEYGYQQEKPENVEILPTGVRVKKDMNRFIFDKKSEIVGTEPGEAMYYEIKAGKGEWEAKTLDDAKEMAIAFAESVS